MAVIAEDCQNLLYCLHIAPVWRGLLLGYIELGMMIYALGRPGTINKR